MPNNIVAVIQARTDSTRLPGKVLVNLKDKPVIEHVYNRVSASNLIHKTFVATTTLDSDNKLSQFCKNNNINLFRGSADDVLDRYYQLCKSLDVEHIVRITADCPVIDPRVIDYVIKIHLKGDFDYTSNTLEVPYPDGQDVEVFKFSSLEKAWKESILFSEREHVTPYIKFNEGIFNIKKVFLEEDCSFYRWTLDEKEDLELIEVFYEKLYDKNPFFGMEDLILLNKENKDLLNINKMHIREEGYKKSLKNDYNIR